MYLPSSSIISTYAGSSRATLSSEESFRLNLSLFSSSESSTISNETVFGPFSPFWNVTLADFLLKSFKPAEPGLGSTLI